jgi:hypothetical protein
VNDLQADYFSLEQNPYLTSAEREAIIKRKEELRQMSLQAKRNILVDVDVSTGEIAEQQKVKKILRKMYFGFNCNSDLRL